MKSALKNFSLLVILIVATKCSKNDDSVDDSDASCFKGLTSITLTYQEAVTQFQENPNENNCNGLKTAAIDLIEAYRKCPQYLNEEGNAAYEKAAQEFKNIDCSGI